jgi:uncharacterized protein YciI
MYLAMLTTNPEKLALRERIRGRHDDYWSGRMDRIRLAGPLLAEDGTTRLGQILVLDADERQIASDLVMNDPYVAEGLFGDIRIERFRMSVKDGVAQT